MAAVKLLQNQLKKIYDEPVEGFTVEVQNDSNMFAWNIYVEGPKDTPYAGGIFKMAMTFPNDFPMSPPTLRFVSEFWHPNVYPDGKVCISILHPPGHDEMSGERPEERWMPTQSVTSVVLSLLSMLGDPNYSSPANVDASVEWRRKPDEFKKRVLKVIEKAKKDIPAGVKIPHPDTDPEERKKALAKQKVLQEDTFDIDEADYEEADYGDFDASDIDEDEDEDIEDEEEEEKPKPKVVKSTPAAAKVEEKKAEVSGANAVKAVPPKAATEAKRPEPAPVLSVPAAAPVAAVTKGKEESKKKVDSETKDKKEKEKKKDKKEKKSKKESGSKKLDKAATKGKDEKDEGLTHSSKKPKTAEPESSKKLK